MKFNAVSKAKMISIPISDFLYSTRGITSKARIVKTWKNDQMRKNKMIRSLEIFNLEFLYMMNH